jgi:hypothetical protein
MKVICTTLPPSPDGEPLKSSPWVTLHADYHVLSVLAVPGRPVQIQILTDNGRTLGWYDSEYFMTVDDTVPDSWSVRIGERGVLNLAPTAWLAPAFWDAYYDDDEPAAIEAVEAELRRLR